MILSDGSSFQKFWAGGEYICVYPRSEDRPGPLVSRKDLLEMVLDRICCQDKTDIIVLNKLHRWSSASIHKKILTSQDHSSTIVRHLLQVNVLPWPASSPDISPPEQLWERHDCVLLCWTLSPQHMLHRWGTASSSATHTHKRILFQNDNATPRIVLHLLQVNDLCLSLLALQLTEHLWDLIVRLEHDLSLLQTDLEPNSKGRNQISAKKSYSGLSWSQCRAHAEVITTHPSMLSDFNFNQTKIKEIAIANMPLYPREACVSLTVYYNSVSLMSFCLFHYHKSHIYLEISSCPSSHKGYTVWNNSFLSSVYFRKKSEVSNSVKYISHTLQSTPETSKCNVCLSPKRTE